MIWIKETSIVTECQNCRSTEGVKDIHIGDERSSQMMHLCDKCRALLSVKLANSVEAEK